MMYMRAFANEYSLSNDEKGGLLTPFSFFVCSGD